MTLLYILIIVFLVLGLIMFVASIRKFWQRRIVSGGVQCLSSLVILSLAAVLFLVILNIYTYHVFTSEEDVATLRFEYITDKQYRLYYKAPNKKEQVYELHGDECRLESRILKWSGTATMLGFDTVFRVERVSGRYIEIENERSAERSVFRVGTEAGIDVWHVAHEHDWLPWIDAVYGNGVYIPMKPDAEYIISMSTTGLVARPGNDVAEQAVKNWKVQP